MKHILGIITWCFYFTTINAQQASTRFDVWGQILDADTHEILSGVKVSLLNLDSVCIGTTTSYNKGIINNNYQIGNVPSTGNYILHLEKKDIRLYIKM